MNPTLESNRRRSLPWALKVVIVLAALLVVLTLAFVIWRGSLASANSIRLRAIKAAGEPASARELNEWYEAVNNQENASLVWLDGIARLNPKLDKNQRTPWSRIKLPASGKRLSPSQLQEAEAIVAENQEPLALFRRATTMTKSRYPVDFSEGAFADHEHLSQIREAGRLLQLESLVHAQNGRSGDSIRSVQGILGVSRSLAQEPLLISQLVRAALDRFAISSTERVLHLTVCTESQLAGLQAAFAAAETPNLSTRALVGERATAITMLNSPQEMKLSTNDLEATETSSLGLEEFGSPLMRPFFQRDLGFLLEAMDTNLAISRLPDPEQFLARTNLDAIESRARRGYYVMAGLILSSHTHNPGRDVAHRARLRTAQTALAIERHRLSNQGKLPASLSALVPKYLSAVPVDPFDGRPIRFKTKADGYVVYSIGPDLADNDGNPLPSGSRANETPHDFPFVMAK